MYADVLWTYPKSPALPCNLSLIRYQSCETGPCPRGGTLKGKRIDMKGKKKILTIFDLMMVIMCNFKLDRHI